MSGVLRLERSHARASEGVGRSSTAAACRGSRALAHGAAPPLLPMWSGGSCKPGSESLRGYDGGDSPKCTPGSAHSVKPGFFSPRREPQCERSSLRDRLARTPQSGLFPPSHLRDASRAILSLRDRLTRTTQGCVPPSSPRSEPQCGRSSLRDRLACTPRPQD